MGEGKRQPRVVIVGGGFAGLYAAKLLGRAGVPLTLVDRRNYHLFQPLLYQVATAALDTSDIAVPIRAVLDSPRTEVILAEVTRVDPARRVVVLPDDELPYDHLVLAAGAEDAYFGHDDWRRHAPGLKSLEDAVEIRRRVFWAFEQAERTRDPELRREWLTFVLVGAGPTGVEMAGALAEIARHALRKDFRHIRSQEARIVLVEGNAHVLPFYPDRLTNSARRTLEKLGVEVRTGTKVQRIGPRAVQVDGETIRCRTVIWAAGVSAVPLGAQLGAPVDKAGRIRVQADLSVPGHPEIFVAGDLAHLEQDGKVIPGVAPAAIQMGKHVARNLLRLRRDQPTLPFRYFDRGTFAVIGRGAAVGMPFGKVPVMGFPAWSAWLFIHLFFLIGFRNRISVMAKWAYAYLTMRRYARLITGVPKWGSSGEFIAPARGARGEDEARPPPFSG